MNDVAVFGLKVDSAQAKLAVEQFERSLGRLSVEGKKAEQVNDALNGSMGRLKRGASEVDAAVARLGKTIGVTLAAGATAAAYAFKTTVDRMDDLSKAAQRASMPTEDFSRLAYAADLADVSMQDLQGSMGRLAKAQGDAARGSKEQAKAFATLGLAYKNADGSLRSTKEVFFDFADRFKQFQGSPEIVALGMTLFGRNFQSLIPLLKDGSAGLKDAGDEAERFGLVVSTQAGQQAEAFNDNLTRLKGAAEGLKIELFSGLIPQLDNLLSRYIALARLGKGPIDLIEGMFGEGPDKKIEGFERRIADLMRIRERLAKEGDPSWWQRALNPSLRTKDSIDQELIELAGKLEEARQFRRMLSPPNLSGLNVPQPGDLPAINGGKAPRDELASVIDAAWQRDYDRMQALQAQAEDFDAFVAQVQVRHEQMLQAQADAWLDSLDAGRKYARQLEEIRDLVKAGKLTKDQGTAAELAVESRRNDDQLKGMADETKKTSDAARELGLTFQSAFEDAIIGGKQLSGVFAGLGQDLLRLTIRKSLVEPAADWFSKLLNPGSLFGLFGNALGNVYQSPSLSAYSNGIYNTPQLFAFAKGAGVFAEAGPEAIMPLKRGKDGKLGVSGEASTKSVVIHQTVNVGAGASRSEVAAAMQIAKEQTKREIYESMRNGGVFS